jgi:hypothetical protein
MIKTKIASLQEITGHFISAILVKCGCFASLVVEA